MKQRPIYGKEPEKTHSTPAETSLDEQISNLTVKTTKGLEKHWKLVAGIAVAALALVAAFQAIEAWGERSEDGHWARLWELTDRLDEKDAPDLAAMQAFLADVQGAKAEKPAHQRIVQFLEERAARLNVVDAFPGAPGAGDERTDAEKAADAKKSLEYLDEAAKIAAAGAERFPGDEGLKTWAESVRKRVDAELDSAWLPEKRSFQLRIPTVGPPSGAASDSGSTTPEADGSAPNATEAAPSSTTPEADGSASAKVNDAAPPAEPIPPPSEGGKTSGAEKASE